MEHTFKMKYFAEINQNGKYKIIAVKENDKGERLDFKEVYDISLREDEVTHLLHLLRKYQVTPVSLEYVVEDFLKIQACRN